MMNYSADLPLDLKTDVLYFNGVRIHVRLLKMWIDVTLTRHYFPAVCH